MSESDQIYLALVQANVWRLRGQWTEAEAACNEVLRLDPGNADACAVLGDIARDQGRREEAVFWYQKALDRNPSDIQVRRRLERLLDEEFAAGGPGPGCRVCGALKLWLTRLGAELRPLRARGPLALAVVGMLGVLLLITFTILLLGRGAEPVTAAPGDRPPSGSFVAAPAGGEAVPAEEPGRDGLAARIADLMAREGELQARVRGAMEEADKRCRVEWVEVDPVTGWAYVRVTLPAFWDPAASRDTALQAIGTAAGAAVGWDGGVVGVRVRCDTGKPEGQRAAAVVAEGTRDQVAKLRTGTAEEVAEAFTLVWVAPELQGR